MDLFINRKISKMNRIIFYECLAIVEGDTNIWKMKFYLKYQNIVKFVHSAINVLKKIAYCFE